MRQRAYKHRFGERIRTVREQRGLSQEELADAAKLHRTHISLIERGQRSVRLETLVRLATALKTQPADLFTAALSKPGLPTTYDITAPVETFITGG